MQKINNSNRQKHRKSKDKNNFITTDIDSFKPSLFLYSNELKMDGLSYYLQVLFDKIKINVSEFKEKSTVFNKFTTQTNENDLKTDFMEFGYNDKNSNKRFHSIEVSLKNVKDLISNIKTKRKNFFNFLDLQFENMKKGFEKLKKEIDNFVIGFDNLIYTLKKKVLNKKELKKIKNTLKNRLNESKNVSKDTSSILIAKQHISLFLFLKSFSKLKKHFKKIFKTIQNKNIFQMIEVFQETPTKLKNKSISHFLSNDFELNFVHLFVSNEKKFEIRSEGEMTIFELAKYISNVDDGERLLESIRDQVEVEGLTKNHCNFLLKKVLKQDDAVLQLEVDSNKINLVSEHIPNLKGKDNPLVVLCQTNDDKYFGGYYDNPLEAFNKKNVLFSMSEGTLHKYLKVNSSLANQDILTSLSASTKISTIEGDFIICSFGERDMTLYENKEGELFCRSSLGENYYCDQGKEFIFGGKEVFALKRVLIFKLCF